MNFLDLGIWLHEHMPDVYEIGDPESIRVRLNEITGLSVASSDLIEESSGRFLEALRKMKEEGKC